MKIGTVSKLGYWLILLFVVSACSKDGPGISVNAEKTDEHRSTSLSYKFTELNFGGAIRCTTGDRTFSSEADLCEGLTQRKENNECGLEDRKQMYKHRGCAGEFEETNFPMFLATTFRENGTQCSMEYNGPNPIRRLADYCAALQKLYADYRCGLESLSEDFKKNGCPGRF